MLPWGCSIVRNIPLLIPNWGKLLAIVILLLTCVQAVISEKESVQYVTRDTRLGKVKGYVHTVKDIGDIERYFGIPYAAPPVGNLRFEYPVDHEGWGDEIYNATVLSPACLQIGSIWEYTEFHQPGFNRQSEDCLYLNVYIPVRTGVNSGGLLEVLVHIHGGSNEVGMGSMLHGDVLALKAGVIFVSMNYRLGPLGFLSGDPKHFTGNYGVMDQVKALQWVQENIGYFGGDKNKVTIQGHSAGACDVGLHASSPLSKGLFRYAILESGSSLAYWCVLRYPEFSRKRTENFAKSVGCMRDNLLEVKECLKMVDKEKINNFRFDAYIWFLPFTVSIGDDFLPDNPEILLAERPINGEAFLMGVTQNEGSWSAWKFMTGISIVEDIGNAIYFIPFAVNKYKDLAVAVLQEEYAADIDPNNGTDVFLAVSGIIGDSTFIAPAVKLADHLAERNKDVYFYSFDYISTLASTPQHHGVPHGLDLFYLFGTPFTGHKYHTYNEEDKAVSQAFIDMWASFIKTGRPKMNNEKADKFIV
ncbi:cholinesterase isoform X2 [Patella vulgata]|uniref:cholinesterase isoform X2 n=1 Tax=Patella vulgata TaxID=6465 RepID=UPI00217F89D3|nr:cholinesterase isoform X2 [Patella vulgata]